jgi:uncharacterized protein involved in response to NO
LWSLALGYAWLVAGLALKGAAQLWAAPQLGGVLHAITIGALGSLTVAMMARTASLRAHRDLGDFRFAATAVALISIAALLRIAAEAASIPRPIALWTAAGAWSSAFVLLLVYLGRTRRVNREP